MRPARLKRREWVEGVNLAAYRRKGMGRARRGDGDFGGRVGDCSPVEFENARGAFDGS